MALDEGTILLNLLMIPGFILLFSLFYYQTQRKNRKASFLSWGLILAIIGQTVYVIGMLMNPTGLELEMTKRLRDFIFGIFYYLLYRHFEALSRESPNRIVTNAFAGIMAVYAILTGSFLLNPQNEIIYELLRRFGNIIGGTAFLYAFIISLRTTLKVNEKESAAETISLALLFFAHIIYVLGDNYFLTILGAGVYEELADMISTFGLFGYVLTYISNIDYLYRLPVPIHQLIIYNEAGLPVYARKVYTQGVESPYVEEALFTGVISAISSLMSDTLGAGVELREIESNKQQVFLRHHNTLSLAIIADAGTRFMTNSLEMLYEQIDDDLRKKLNQGTVDLSTYQEELDNLVQKSFPYIHFRD